MSLQLIKLVNFLLPQVPSPGCSGELAGYCGRKAEEATATSSGQYSDSTQEDSDLGNRASVSYTLCQAKVVFQN